MSILVFKRIKDKDPKLFIRYYKKMYISIESKATDNWVVFLLEFLEDGGCQWYERQLETTKVSWDRLNVGLVTKSS